MYVGNRYRDSNCLFADMAVRAELLPRLHSSSLQCTSTHDMTMMSRQRHVSAETTNTSSSSLKTRQLKGVPVLGHVC